MLYTINNKDLMFDKLEFVLRARSTDKEKIVLDKLYVEDTRIICADGYRLHIWNASKELEMPFEPGFYDLIKKTAKEIIINKVDFDGKFPNVDLLVPALTRCKDVKEITLNGYYKNDPGFSISYSDLCRLEDSLAFNLDLLQDACKGTSKGYYIGLDRPLTIINGDLFALVMPIKIHQH